MTDFLANNLPVVFFFYGLAFFSMGLAITLEIGRFRGKENPFAWALAPLGWFGLIHGSHKWFEMAWCVGANSSHICQDFAWLRLSMLTASFFVLLQFGMCMISGPKHCPRNRLLLLIPMLLWGCGLIIITITGGSIPEMDVFTRYTLAIPGSLLTAWGLYLQYGRFRSGEMRIFGMDVLLAAAAFFIYGVVGQIFTNPSQIFPSNLLNSSVFMNWFGFPVQILRALMASIAAIFIIRSLRSFEFQNSKRLEELHRLQVEEHRKLETLRAEMLYHTVRAQEAERQRIARELHDETGQTLTALGLGLQGLSASLDHPVRVAENARKLSILVENGLKELQHLVSGLHPPQLSDLGLLPALRWYARDISENFQLKVSVENLTPLPEMSIELRTVLYRIAQEAVTNSLRHAQASQVSIVLGVQGSQVVLQVTDNGVGFDDECTMHQKPDCPCWGLLGMQERARLAGGTCTIKSQPGKGTQVLALIPLSHGVAPNA